MALTDDDLEKIAGLLAPLTNRLDSVDRRFDSLEASVDRRFETLETSIAEFRSETLSNFDALFLRDEKREQENALGDEKVNRLENRVGELEKKVA